MVKPFVKLSTLKTVVKSVVDSTEEGYEVAYECYFNAQIPFNSRSADSLEDPKSCTD